MALLGKSKSPPNTVLPDEVNQYYQSKRRERRGVAIILGIIALIVTLLIGALLFLAGRFVYQKVFNDDKPAETVNVIDNKNANQNIEVPSIDGEKKSGGVVDAPQNPAPTTPPATPAGPSGNTNAGVTPTPQTATPSLGDDPTVLPATGDEGH